MQGIEDAIYNIEAAERLNLKQVAHISRQNLAFLRFVYRAKFNEPPTVPNELRPEGVAEAILDLLEDSAASLDRIVKLARDGESDGEKEIDKTDPPHRPVSKIRVLMSDTESDLVIASESDDSEPEDNSKESNPNPSDNRRRTMKNMVQSGLTTERRSVHCPNALFMAVTCKGILIAMSARRRLKQMVLNNLWP